MWYFSVARDPHSVLLFCRHSKLYYQYLVSSSINSIILDLLGQLTHQRVGHLAGDTLLEEDDEAPPAYEDRNSDSPPLLPPTPVSLQAPLCFGTSCRGRYTPTHHFNTCPGGGASAYCTPHNITNSPLIPTTTSHYTPLNNSDYAVISQAPSIVPLSEPSNQQPLHRQYSRDVDLQAAGHRQFNEGYPPLELPVGFNHDNIWCCA